MSGPTAGERSGTATAVAAADKDVAKKAPTGEALATLIVECCTEIEAAIAKRQPAEVRLFHKLPLFERNFHAATLYHAIDSLLAPSHVEKELSLSSLRKPLLDAVDVLREVSQLEAEEPDSAPHASDTSMGDSSAAATTTDRQASAAATSPYMHFCSTETAKTQEWELMFAAVVLHLLLLQRKLQKAAHSLAEAVVAIAEERAESSTHEYTCASEVLHFCGMAYERAGALKHLRAFYLVLHRRSITIGDVRCQIACLNWILRLLIQENQYPEAWTFVQRAPWPSNANQAGTQHCRYLYYLARIHAIRLDYVDAQSKVDLALRKAPQGHKAIGFRLAATKLAIAVQLLLGEIPPRLLFADYRIGRRLVPYVEIVQAVRAGDVPRFRETFTKWRSAFHADGNLPLIRRLEHNVVRIGLLRISASYSHIHLADVGVKLGLTNLDDARCVISKAIADGVIDAMIQGDTNVVVNTTPITQGWLPDKAFNERIAFCLQLYNDAVQAMQYKEQQPEEKNKGAFGPQDLNVNQDHIARMDTEAFEEDEFH